MMVYIITREEQDEPSVIMGVWASREDMAVAWLKYRETNHSPFINYETCEYEVSPDSKTSPK